MSNHFKLTLPMKMTPSQLLNQCSRLYFLEEAFKIKITFSLFTSRFWSLLRESLTWPLLITICFCSFDMEVIRSLVTKLNPNTWLSAISQLTTLLDLLKSLSSSIFLILPYLAIKRHLCAFYILDYFVNSGGISATFSRNLVSVT